jgi:hypothetical protein
MPAADPSTRLLIAQIAAHEKWAATDDRTAATAAARAAFTDRFEREVDPDGQLDPAERARSAESKRRAHFRRLALKSAQSRRKAREAIAVAEVAESELDSLGGDLNGAA